MDIPVSTYFPIRHMVFSDGGAGDAIAEDVLVAEVVGAGDGCVEFAFTDGDERRYISFRLSDFRRAMKEATE